MIRRAALIGMAGFLSSMAMIAVADGTGGAAMAPAGTGELSCSVGGSVSFSPPLTYSPEPGGKGQHQLAFVGLQLTNCSGSSSNTPQPNPTSATQKGNGVVHIKPTKVEFMGHISKGVGGCGYSDFDPDGNFHANETWFDTFIAKTKLKVQLNTTGGSVNGTSSGSYAGDVNGTLNLTAASASDYNSVCNGDPDGSGSISTLDFDQSTSSIAIGVPTS